MFAVCIIGLLITLALACIRAALGPTVFDRILAVNAIGTQTVLIIAVSGFLTGRPEWLDLALTYALMSFVSVIAVLKFARFGNLAQDDPTHEVPLPEEL